MPIIFFRPSLKHGLGLLFAGAALAAQATPGPVFLEEMRARVSSVSEELARPAPQPEYYLPKSPLLRTVGGMLDSRVHFQVRIFEDKGAVADFSEAVENTEDAMSSFAQRLLRVVYPNHNDLETTAPLSLSETKLTTGLAWSIESSDALYVFQPHLDGSSRVSGLSIWYTAIGTQPTIPSTNKDLK